MAAAPNYHNRQNNPDFASPYSNKAFSMQRNPRYDDKKDAESENPFYDNRYEHNLNVVRGKPQEPTLDLRNQQFPSLSQIPDVNPTTDRNQRRDDVQNPGYQDFPVPNERKPLERNEAPFFKDYDKKNLQDNNKGDFMRGLGENNRHANIVKEYQQYMRNNPIPAPKVRKSSGIEEMEKNRISLKKRNGQDQQGSDWYGSNVGVGILPGMGGQSENRRGGAAQRQQNMPDYRQPVAGYGYDAPEGLNRGYAEDYRRPMPDPRNEPNLPNKMNHQPSGSRLAGIGSRIIDAERPYYDQMRTPQYTPSKDAIRGNFATPQNPRKSFEGGPGFGGRMKEMQGYSEGANRYERGSYEGPGEGVVNSFEPQVQGNAQRGSNNRRGERDVDGGQEGTSWLEQRQKQEQDKKQQQRDELQRIYREQIEEKKRKKEEEQMRQLMEDKKEEERLRRENEDLQRQFQLEQQKKKDAEQATKAPVKNEVVPDNDYVIQGGRKRPKKQQQAFETSAENAMRPEPMEQMEDYRPRYEEQEEMTLDDMIRQNEKRFDEDVAVRQRYEFSKDPEMEVHREITRQINATLDDQLEKMKRDVEYHAKLLRNELTSYKTQAMVSQELRHNAQKELQRLKEDLRHQRVEEERRPYDNFEFLGDQQGGKGQKRDHERPEEKFSMNLNKKYAKTFTPDEDGPSPNLGISSGGGTLEFETNYVMAAEAGAENKMFREPPKLGELMHRYGVDDDEYAAKHRKDKALKKFDSLFGQKEDGEADSIAALEAQLNSNNAHLIGYGQQGLQNKVSSPVKAKAELPRYNAHNDKEVRDYHREEPNVEGEDEIERIEFLLKQYTDPSLNDKGRGKDVKREEQLDYRVSEQKIFQELEAEGISATHYNMQNQYEDQEEDEEHEYRGEEEGEEGTPRSEVELANVTHEVDMSQNHLKRRR